MKAELRELRGVRELRELCGAVDWIVAVGLVALLDTEASMLTELIELVRKSRALAEASIT